MGVAIRIVKIVRSTQIIINFGILTGISVDKIQGTKAEKKIMADTDKTATMNLVTNAALAVNREGRNISAISIAEALAASSGSGNWTSHVNG